ncbi:rho GTPase-activating protein 26-like isoform X2 [Orbicella faveolata]|uniref:rho GTPase-activating protein 26-like isoform X2 n=1 Tax=Orbicella faveolata TaxID=48498 RepID=UPI0009E5A1E2|nr:rho GTPase-activating protein 26-like isoform X2 [Orbicella faveolata]
MGLKPLEFEDCILDSPYFRENIHEHERELERTNEAIKRLIKECKALLKAIENLSKAQRSFAQVLDGFRFECIGEVETDDEIHIAEALKEFGKMIDTVEDERDRMLNHANAQLIIPLETFRKEQIGGAKEEKKKFDKQTEKYCLAVQNYLNLSSKKKDSFLNDADTQLQNEKRSFHQTALDYVVKLQEVNEKKKFEFVETLLSFMYGHITFYHSGHEVFNDYMDFMKDLQLRLQNTRERFDTTKIEAASLMSRVQQKALSGELQYRGAHTRQGYLGVQKKGSLGTYTWNKHFCMYTKENKILTMIPYTQTQGRLNASTDTIIVTSCTRKMTDSIDRRFTFEITALERNQPILLQAQDEEDRKLWLEAMDGKEPLYVDSNSLPKYKDQETSDLELTFIMKCISAVEKRGITDQGLYRIVGVGSKVQNLLLQCIDKKKAKSVDLANEECEWEVKTITSALKQYLRNMPEPLFTYDYHEQFLDSVKKDTYEKRVEALRSLVADLPEENRTLIRMIMKHLTHVAAHSNKNLMAASNLGVVFGPTLMKSREETMAAIMNLKYQSIVIELLINEFNTIFGPDSPDGSENSTDTFNSVESTGNPFIDEKDSSPIANEKPKPPPKKRNSDETGTKLSDGKPVTPTKPLPLPSKAYRAPPPPNKPAPATKPRVKAIIVSNSEDDLSSLSEPSSLNSTPQSESKPPFSPRDFWKEKAGKPAPPPKKPEVVNDKDNTPGIRRFSSQGGSLNRGLQSWGTGPPPLPREPPPHEEPTPPPKTPKKVRTIYPCVAENSSELSFDAGMVISNVRPSKEPGWLEGTLNGRTGLVPENYVESIT